MRDASRAWDVLMLNARRQAEDYARALPADHGWPPFILVCDVGHVIEVYADFCGQGRNCVLHLAGLLRWRRHAHAMAALSVRALPDRGASNSHWLLLSPGGDLRRLVGPVLSYFATSWQLGFAIPMMIGTTVAAGSVFVSMLFSPETKGTEMVSDIQLA
jgi:hypothetical protein